MMFLNLPLVLAALSLSLLQLDQVPLEEYRNREVVVRGYAIQSQKGDWFLSSQPDLPSCCAGSAAKLKGQIGLGEGFPGIESSGGQLLRLRGVFRILETLDGTGIQAQHYHLDAVFLEK